MKTYIAIMIFAAVAVGGGIVYVNYPNIFPKKETENQLESQVPNLGESADNINKAEQKPKTDTDTQLKTITRSEFKQLFASGAPAACTLALKQPINTTGSFSYKTYLASGRIRTDFSIKVGTKTITSHLLVDNAYSYGWNEGAKSGLQETIAADTELEKALGDFQKNISNQEADNLVLIQCQPWKVDESLFVKPNITFYDNHDPAALKKVLEENTASFGIDPDEYKKTLCNLCNSLKIDADKQNCKIEAKCSM